MAYYGGGPPPHGFSGPQGSGQFSQHAYGNQGPPGSHHLGMYPQQGPPQGHFNEYNGNQMHSSYGQHQEYFEPQQHQMYDPSMNQNGPAPLDPRTQMMQTSKSSQSGRGETTKILRNPYPVVSDEIKQKDNEIYDPSNPTGPTTANLPGGRGQFNQQQRTAPPPPSISGMQPGPMHNMSMSGHPGGIQQAAPIYDDGMTRAGHNGAMYGSAPYGNNAAHLQTQQAPAPPQASYQPFPGAPYGNSNSQQPVQPEQPAASSKMQVMTGVVTQVQPGSFGMVSEEIFFQEHVVSGPLPRLGDKVVVEAEPVSGMPFKFNAKRVTRLDVDLVREEKNASAPAPPVIQQQSLQQSQQYQPPQQFQNPQPTQNYSQSSHDFGSRWEAPNFGPLPSLPDSLNLPRPVPPPNLASVLPSNSNAPLKSILKRKGSPSLKRNPPPPPVISKNAGKQDVNPYQASAPSSLKQSVFTMDLERDVPRVLPPQGTGPPIEFPEYSFFNKERPRAPASPRITRLLPQSPIPEFGNRRSNSVDNSRNQPRGRSRSRSRDRGRESPKRRRSRSKSPRRHASRRSRSRSKTPIRQSGRRSRSRSNTPKRRSSRRSRSKSISPRRSRRTHTHSRSPSSARHRRYSRSPSPRTRRRSRSVTPRSRPHTSRSLSRDRDRRSDSRGRRVYRTRRSQSRSRSRSKSRSPYRSRYSSGGRRSRSNSPHSSGGVKVLGETVTHGIVVKHVSSDLFPKIKGRAPEVHEVEVIRRDGKGNLGSNAKPSSGPPAPIKFQIANPSNKPPPLASSSLVPNPTFKAANMAPPTYLQNPVYNITKTVANPLADAKNKKKKSKEQEPAFRVIDKDTQDSVDAVAKADDKMKQWEAERQALKSKTMENVNNLLKNPVNILQLKQTIQNDLHELRTKGQSDVGKKLLENPIDIEKLKQTVQRDLQAIKSKEITLSTSTGAKEKNARETKSPVPVINKVFDEKVEQRLKDLRSKFESQIKDAKASVAAATSQKNSTQASKASPPVASNSSMEKQKVSLVTDNLKDNNKAPAPRFPNKHTSDASSERSRGPPRRHGSPPPIELPPYDEQMERLQEEIHQQRFMEEEQRLKSMGDQQGLRQLHYMEDRRRRRMDERHLARIRMMEIQLKKDKKFGDLARLREEWGPPAKRLEHERELRRIRMDEEQHENQLHGQGEAIRRQEYEYQRWLEEEAAARNRNFQENPRPSRGCEGRVLRRRTPSPSNPRNQPPPDARGPHPLRRRSRSPSFERYKQDWFARHPRDRSPPMSYEQFTMRYPIGPPANFMPPGDFRPHPDFQGPPHPLEEEGFFISRAMDDVARRQDELMHREMEIQHRIEMAQRRIGGGGPPPPNRNDRDSDREEIRRYPVPRR